MINIKLKCGEEITSCLLDQSTFNALVSKYILAFNHGNVEEFNGDTLFDRYGSAKSFAKDVMLQGTSIGKEEITRISKKFANRYFKSSLVYRSMKEASFKGDEDFIISSIKSTFRKLKKNELFNFPEEPEKKEDPSEPEYVIDPKTGAPKINPETGEKIEKPQSKEDKKDESDPTMDFAADFGGSDPIGMAVKDTYPLFVFKTKLLNYTDFIYSAMNYVVRISNDFWLDEDNDVRDVIFEAFSVIYNTKEILRSFVAQKHSIKDYEVFLEKFEYFVKKISKIIKYFKESI